MSACRPARWATRRSATSTWAPAGRSSRTCRGSTPRSPTAPSSSVRPCSRPANAPPTAEGPSTWSASSAPAASMPTTGTSSRSSSWRRGAGSHASASTRSSTGATRRRRSALGFVADLERRLAAAHPDARIATVGGRYFAMDRDRRWERSSAATTRSSTRVRAPRSDRRRRDRGRLRPRRDRRVRGPDRHRRHGRRHRRRRRGRPRQLPGRPGAPADPRPRRRPVVRRVRPGLANGPRGAGRAPGRDDDRVRGRPAGRGRLPARGRPLARRGGRRRGLAPVPRRRDREVRPRHVLLQRRRRGRPSRARTAGSSRARRSRPTTSRPR